MKLNTLKKRSATFVFRASSPSSNINGLVTALNNISSDLGDLYNEWNNKLKPAFDGLPKGIDDEIVGLSSTIDAVGNGLDGANLFSDRDADEDSPEWLFSTTLDRQLTVKESLAEIYESLKEQIDAIVVNEDSGVSQYTIDYIGAEAFSSSDTSSPTSMDGRIGTLEAWIAAADYASTTDLDAVKTYIGMTGSETVPVFTDHTSGGTLLVVADGNPLEKAIALIDQAMYLPSTYVSGRILFGNGTKYPITSSQFIWDESLGRLGIKTSTPTAELDVGGKIAHSLGIISTGGNTRGNYATDLQSFRTVSSQVASGDYSSILGGRNNKASGVSATAWGSGNAAVADFSTAMGYEAATIWIGEVTSSNGMFSAPGDNGYSRIHLRTTSSSTGPDTLYLDGSSVSPILNDNSTYGVEAHIVGRDSANEHCYYVLNFLIRRSTGVGSTTLVGSITKTVVAETSAGLDASVVANTTSGSFDLTVNGLAATNMKWSAVAHITKITF